MSRRTLVIVSLRNRRARGNTLIEAAFIFPLMLLTIVGILEAGRAWFSYNLLTHATREAARMASVRPALQINDATVLGRINQILADGGLHTSLSTLNYVQPLQTGRLVSIAAEVEFQPLFIVLLPPDQRRSIPLRTEVITRYEV